VIDEPLEPSLATVKVSPPTALQTQHAQRGISLKYGSKSFLTTSPIDNRISIWTVSYGGRYGRPHQAKEPTSKSTHSAGRATNFCQTNVEGSYLDVSARSFYDIAQRSEDPSPLPWFQGFLNQAWVQRATGVPTNYTVSNRSSMQLCLRGRRT